MYFPDVHVPALCVCVTCTCESDFFLIQQVKIALSLGTPFQCFHHHLIYMLEKIMGRAERRVFNSLASTSAVIEFLRDNYGF